MRPLFSTESDFDRLLRMRRVEDLDEALGRGFDINMRDESGDTLLLRVLAEDPKTLAWCNALLDRGADIDVQNSMGNTALMMAVFHTSVDLVELLCKRGANLDSVNNYNDTAIGVVFDTFNLASRVSLLRLLLAHGADPNKTFGDKDRTLLHQICHLSAENAGLDLLSVLPETGIKPDVRDEAGRTPLWYAVMEPRYFPVARWLLEHGSDPDLATDDEANIYLWCHELFRDELVSHRDRDLLTKHTSSVDRTKTHRL